MNLHTLEGPIFLLFGTVLAIWTIANWHNNSLVPRMRIISAFLIILYGIYALMQFPLSFLPINHLTIKRLFEEDKKTTGASILLFGIFLLIIFLTSRKKFDKVSNVQTITGAISGIFLGIILLAGC